MTPWDANTVIRVLYVAELSSQVLYESTFYLIHLTINSHSYETANADLKPRFYAEF